MRSGKVRSGSVLLFFLPLLFIQYLNHDQSNSVPPEYYGLVRQYPSGKQVLKVWFPTIVQVRGDWIRKAITSLMSS